MYRVYRYMHIGIYLYMHRYMYMYRCVHVCRDALFVTVVYHMHMCIRMCEHILICVASWLSRSMCLHVYRYTGVHIYTYKYIYVYMYTYNIHTVHVALYIYIYVYIWYTYCVCRAIYICVYMSTYNIYTVYVARAIWARAGTFCDLSDCSKYSSKRPLFSTERSLNPTKKKQYFRTLLQARSRLCAIWWRNMGHVC